MKIGLRGGHSPNCKGAIGLIDEQAEDLQRTCTDATGSRTYCD